MSELTRAGKSPSFWFLLDAFCVTLRMRQIRAEVYPVQLGPVRTAEAQATNCPDPEYFVYVNLMVHQFCIYIYIYIYII